MVDKIKKEYNEMIFKFALKTMLRYGQRGKTISIGIIEDDLKKKY